jgi:hypothetical protein
VSKIESQYLFEREVDATLTRQFGQGLEDVNRALEKIEEGTYSLSERSGEPTPRGRLEAIPEASTPSRNSSGARENAVPSLTSPGDIIGAWNDTLTGGKTRPGTPSFAATSRNSRSHRGTSR